MSRPDAGVHFHRRFPVLPLPLVGGPGQGKEVLRLLRFPPHAEHLPAGLLDKIAVGKPVPRKRQPKLLQLLRGRLPVFPDGSGIDPRDHRHILRAFHAALQLHAGHPQLLQLPQVPRQGHVLEGEWVFVGLAAPAVGQAAGLGAHAPVPAPPPDDGGEKALAGVAHTQGPVYEHFNFNGGVGADIGDLGPVQLSGEDHTLHAQVGAPQYAVQGMDGHLGGGVDLQVRGGLLEHPQYAQVLNQHRVHTHLTGLDGQLCRGGELPVREQGIEGQINFCTPKMAVRNRRRRLFLGKIFGAAAGVEVPESQIDGVRPVLHGGGYRLRRPGGGE